MQDREKYAAAPTGTQAAGYGAFTDLGGVSPREAEVLAFGLCNTRLANASDARSRIAALQKNQQLWSMLVRDLASEGNFLPDTLKQQLIDLGFWAMRYGTLAISQDLPLDPLISVNRNILEGLRAQVGCVERAQTLGIQTHDVERSSGFTACI